MTTNRIDRRNVIKGFGAASLLGGAMGQIVSPAKAWSVSKNGDPGFAPITGDAKAISTAERKTRITKLQKLMRERGIGAVVIEAGSSLTYFTGIRWWRSERFTGAVVPAEGDFAIITPYFEEPSIREQMAFGDNVRTWHEHESPFALVTGFLKEKKLSSKPLAIEETVRQFIPEGIAEADPNVRIVSGKQVVRGCRMIKSPAELALMQVANDVTMAAYRHIYPKIEAGMTRADVSGLMNKATTKLGGKVKFSICLVGSASAFPHGTRKTHVIKEGEVILMDCGCDVLDYESDISRTWVFGEASEKQRDVWNTVKRGQELALETAQVGAEVGSVDDKVRRYYESLGYGPGYAAPGLTHRLGHGIGMDGHEPVNFVHGEKALLAPGMCFSNEPGIYIPGEFGVRQEDCLYITEDGPKLFTPFSESIDNPMNI